MNVVVRPFAPDDAPVLTDLLNAIIARGGTTARQIAFTPEALTKSDFNSPDVHICLVAVDPATNRIEGYQTLGRNPDLPGEIGDIATFARINGAQRGVGSALFAAMIDAARAHGLTAINATIRADNTGGLAFYTKQGFADHAVTVAIPLADGTPVDRIHKRYVLAEAIAA